jgi:hypothetical protein
MSDKRFWFGVAASIIWIGAIIWLTLWHIDLAQSMKPNEWGDFFAGVFSPLAFLWLILGYLQQGEELKQSTQALQLQAEELRNSVEQQRALVEVSRQQVESERRALALEIRTKQEGAKPIFLVRDRGGSFAGDGSGKHNLVIANAGSTARNVLVSLRGLTDESLTIVDRLLFEHQIELQTSISVATPFPDVGAFLDITYIDALGQHGKKTFKVAKLRPVLNSELSFSELDMPSGA